MALKTGGFGTRTFFLPNSGINPKDSQILKGSGYATINIRGAHYSSAGNLWQKIFGGNDKVTLSTQLDYVANGTTTSVSSIEDVRNIQVGHPYYFDGSRSIGMKLPTDCDAIGMSTTISSIKNDNLSGALAILNNGELKSTLQLAPPAVSSALAVAGIVKKLLTNTDPQNSLQAPFAGKLSTAASSDPVRDNCLLQGTLISIYRESDNDISLDTLDPTKLSLSGDGLRYDGQAVQNTYVMFQISFDELKGENASQWSSAFSDAETSLLAVQTAATDDDKQKIWAAAFSSYQQAVKLLNADPEYTRYEKRGIAASHLVSLKQAFTDNGGHFPPAPAQAMIEQDAVEVDLDSAESIAAAYSAKLEQGQFALPGGRSHAD